MDCCPFFPHDCMGYSEECTIFCLWRDECVHGPVGTELKILETPFVLFAKVAQLQLYSFKLDDNTTVAVRSSMKPA